MPITVSALYRYPIKSCKGHLLQEASTDPRGIAGDRNMMVVDVHNEFLTQRELPRLALVEPVLRGNVMTLRAPGMEELSFVPTNDGRRVQARCGRVCAMRSTRATRLRCGCRISWRHRCDWCAWPMAFAAR